MLPVQTVLLLAGLVALPGVSAHGHVNSITVDGVVYGGWLADSYPWNPSPPDTIGWKTTVTDNGFVAPNQFQSQDIICHRGAEPGKIGAPVRAGGSVTLQWNTWPDSHHGPVIEYMAKVNGDWSSINKGSLQWFKTQERGLISGSNPGLWASDQLITNGNRWTTTIPASLAPGKYVLRHEIIALHSGGQQNGAQNYPQCINLEVTGSGNQNPGGTPATSFYRANDPGILFNLYGAFSSYPIPGPALFRG
ncbi:hypothetical protein AJ80_08763 [Polytolypa hystricis UAMH7299]|uniref:Auxiliary Activity family 9 catalytic domain-containing protein n=1 Tax=Polytolypa hystricis (strain UAMH7299) TaxID=1447883 RepID=A0A2B7X2F0_POLH7|nr:hypothetical protein AJ80_08763 [Polytolypa hystricis UAMH7299]